jgi:hypothetical protein
MAPRRSLACGPPSWGRSGWVQETVCIERYRQLWDARFDRLDNIVEQLKRKEKADERKKRE